MGDSIGALDTTCIGNKRSNECATYHAGGCQLETGALLHFDPKLCKVGYAVIAHFSSDEEDEEDTESNRYINVNKNKNSAFLSKLVIGSISPHNFSMYTNGDYISFVLKHYDNFLYSSFKIESRIQNGTKIWFLFMEKSE